jgi:hypothetical protein
VTDVWRDVRLSVDSSLGEACSRASDGRLGRNASMTCRSCGAENQTKFSAEINIHFPGLKNLDKPAVLVFPELLLCLDCGFTEFAIAETELRLLAGVAASK